MASSWGIASLSPPHIPYLHPLPSTTPLPPLAAALPPILYYLAGLLLPPIPTNPHPFLTAIIRNILALTSFILFLRLPLAHHVPSSVGLTYQLGLVGLYGSARVLDLFILGPYLYNHIPRRVKYHHAPLTPSNAPACGGRRVGPDAESYFSLHFLQPATGAAVTETALSEHGWPTDIWDRMSWALELELSMRGAGFTWTSADVRHTKRTWRPRVRDQVHGLLVHVSPVLLVSWAVIRDVYVHYLAVGEVRAGELGCGFDGLPWFLQAVLTAALGAFLLAAFNLGHTMFAIMLAPLSPHPLSYFPPLYSLRVWEITSVRGFWSFGWHRLFSRLFLVYGVWPGEWLERKLTGKRRDEPADSGKVLGAFLSSAFVHSFAGYTVVPGGWQNAGGEAWFFAENGLAVIVEEGVKRWVLRRRKRTLEIGELAGEGAAKGKELQEWYDGIVGRVWWIAVLLYTGRNFARGWVLAALVREMALA